MCFQTPLLGVRYPHGGPLVSTVISPSAEAQLSPYTGIQTHGAWLQSPASDSLGLVGQVTTVCRPAA